MTSIKRKSGSSTVETLIGGIQLSTDQQTALAAVPGVSSGLAAKVDKTSINTAGTGGVAGYDDTQTKLGTKVAKGDLVVNVKDYGAKGDGTTDDTASIQAAVTAAITAKAELFVPRGTYPVSAPVNCGGAIGLVVRGAGKRVSKIIPVGNVTSAFTATTSCSDVSFERLGFVGTAVDDVTGPRRAREYAASSFQRAIFFAGNLASGYSAVIRDVAVRDCYFYGTSNLPVFLSGIRGEARITESFFDNNLDVGFTFNESAVFLNNRVTRSADNGVSLSRGNQKVACVGNTFEDCCYWAIWVAGFNSDAGPQNFTVTGNVGRNLGFGGVCADNGPQKGIITGNEFYNLLRGPSDEASDVYGVGVYIAGAPSSAPSSPTTYAQDITVAGNTIIDAARGGILVRGAKAIGVFANTIVRPGYQFLADGTTAVTTGMPSQNFGVAVDASYSTSVDGLAVIGNYVIDNRSTQYLNNAVYWGSASNVSAFGNTAVGNRLQLNESAQTFNTGVKTFNALLQAVAGVRSGSTNASGSITQRVTGGGGSSREFRLDTNDQPRWMVRANTTTESGSGAGSDFELRAYDDTGTFLSTPIAVRRSDGRVTLSAAIVSKGYATGSRPSASSVGVGGQVFDTTLNKPIWSDGSAWVDATGATA